MTQFLLISLLLTSVAFAGDATVVKVFGNVTVMGRPLKKDDILKEDQVLVVNDAKSLAQIRLSDGSRVLFKKGEFKLSQSDAKDNNLISIVRGIMFAEKAKKTNSSLEVRSGQATMGVRGTKFYVEVEKETYLCVCDGTVEIKNDKSRELVSKDEDVIVSADQPFKKTKAKDMMIKLANSGFKEMD
jgi:ferric-dicitrate binding protein FerR (iron transport regulator)